MPQPNANGAPDWYQPETPEEIALASKPTVALAGNDPHLSWYTPDPDPPNAAAKKQQPAPAPDNPWADVRNNVMTGLERVPGAILGTPRLLAHADDWVGAALENGAGALAGNDPHLSADDLDKQNPFMSILPSSGAVDSAVFKATGTKPYTPQTPYGRIGQALVTGAGAGLVDPAADIGAASNVWRVFKQLAGNAAKTGAAAGAAEGSQEILPNTPALAAAAALATHGGINLANATAGRVLASTARQIFRPSAAGKMEAANVLDGIDNSLPGIAQPTDANLAGATDDVASATGAWGPGLEPWQAGSDLRDALQSRVDNLTEARTAATAPLLAARDASPNLVDIDPVLSMIGRKLGTAAGAQADAINGALSDLKMPSGALRQQGDQLAASRQAINSRISAATWAGDNATASHLLDIRNALDAQVNAAVPEAGQFNQTFADYSRPLDPMQFGPVGKMLDRDRFNSRYTFPDERIPDLFLRSPATRTDLNRLVSAFGGNSGRRTWRVGTALDRRGE